jgi:hypothetical protein
MLRRVSAGLPPLMRREGCGDLISSRFFDGQGCLSKLARHRGCQAKARLNKGRQGTGVAALQWPRSPVISQRPTRRGDNRHQMVP